MKQQELSQKRKEQMAASLKRIMARKSIQKITIQEIADDCGMNRYTFYYHFQDIYDLLSWTFRQDFETLFRNRHQYSTWEEWIQIILAYLKENAQFCKCAVNSIGRDTLKELCRKDLVRLVEDLLAEIQGEQELSRDFMDFLSSFYLEAFCGILIQWIMSDMSIPEETLIRYLHLTLNESIKHILTRASIEFPV